MLTGLSIRDFVLVRALDLDLEGGFSALTGETGAGKSILMSALGFALGARAGQGLIRPGAETASVTASFEAGPRHPVRALLSARGIEAPEEALVFRRVVRKGGAARAFLNDVAVSASLLEEAGSLLADVHGQHEGLGLLNPARHRVLLDAYAKSDALLGDVARAWVVVRCAQEARAALEARMVRAASERTWLAHALEELDALDPVEGETQTLSLDRATMQAGERVAEAIDSAAHLLAKANVEGALSNAARAVSRALSAPGLNGEAAGSDLAVRMRAACESLERALIEAGEARSALDAAAAACEFSPAALEASETRLFALRAAARKHDVDADQLAALRTRLRMQLDEIEHSDGALKATLEAEAKASAGYDDVCARLTAVREAAAKKLAKAVGAELGPLKLEKARFRVAVSPARRGRADRARRCCLRDRDQCRRRLRPAQPYRLGWGDGALCFGCERVPGGVFSCRHAGVRRGGHGRGRRRGGGDRRTARSAGARAAGAGDHAFATGCGGGVAATQGLQGGGGRGDGHLCRCALLEGEEGRDRAHAGRGQRHQGSACGGG